MITILVSRVAFKGYNPDQPRDPAGTSTGGQWTSDGGESDDKPMPSPDDLLPTWVYKVKPEAFQNNLVGCNVMEGGRYGWIDSRHAKTPYEAMDGFAAAFGDGRQAQRVFGDTPINRFIFQFVNGENYYEVTADDTYNSGLWHIYESSTRFERGRGKAKIPFWSDVK